jgi:glycosyltransferase involved in cell wall biosynthesis
MIPTVSIVVPTFNELPAVVIESLNSLKNQTFADFECIVVDDSNLALSANACRHFCATDHRFIYIKPETRLGLSSSANLGLQLAKGKYIARFDSDDICLINRLALQVSFLESNPDVSVLGGSLEIINDDGVTTSYRNYPLDPDAIARGMHLTATMAQPTVMFRKFLLDKYGFYNPSFPFSEDLDLWLRWLNVGVKFSNLPEVLIKYRQKQTSRPTKHWLYNLRARLLNFSRPHFLLRIFGICCIAVWVIIPRFAQQFLFGNIMLQSKR